MARVTRRRVAASPGSRPEGEHRSPAARPGEGMPRAAGGGRSSLGAGLAPAPARRRNPLHYLRRLQPRFVADIIGELRKVTWPTFSETQYLTIVVAIVSIAVGLFLGGLDLVFGWTVERLFF